MIKFILTTIIYILYKTLYILLYQTLQNDYIFIVLEFLAHVCDLYFIKSREREREKSCYLNHKKIFSLLKLKLKLYNQ